MTLFPLMDCCELLAIDPKTLRHWLKQAAMSLSVHPVDKRRKYLTQEQVQQLAILHDRILKTDEPRPSVSLVEHPALEAPQEPAHQDPTSHMERGKTAGVDDGSLRQKLSQLEAQVIVQQQQLILLTRDLLRERATRMDQRFSPCDASVQPRADPEILDRHQENVSPSLFVPQDPVRPLHPAEQRARFLVLPPLIEYSASGTYVVISSQEGEIPLIPDSLEWFEWFRTLSSFRFVGQSGRVSACRGYNRRRPIRTWYAYRTIHQHDYKHYLGLSEHLTVAHLEAMAAKFQSYVDAL
jgi:hypothetical protein